MMARVLFSLLGVAWRGVEALRDITSSRDVAVKARLKVPLPQNLSSPDASAARAEVADELCEANSKCLDVWMMSPSNNIQKVIDWNKPYLPTNTRFHVFDDGDGMETKFKEFADMLKKENVTDKAWESFQMLRPIAFRADFLRFAALWAHGGLWLDDKMLLTAPLSEWIDLEHDEIVLPHDPPTPVAAFPFDVLSGHRAICNTVLYSKRPRHVAWELAIKKLVDNVQTRFYGYCIRGFTCESVQSLAITGPHMLYEALRNKMGEFNHSRTATLKMTNNWLDPDTWKFMRVRETGFLSFDRVMRFTGRPAHMVLVSTHNKSNVLAVADRKFAGTAEKPGENDLYYRKLYDRHQVYCDEPGPKMLCKTQLGDFLKPVTNSNST